MNMQMMVGQMIAQQAIILLRALLPQPLLPPPDPLRVLQPTSLAGQPNWLMGMPWAMKQLSRLVLRLSGEKSDLKYQKSRD